ncbi:PREDICTED: uncharacterized protein LOC109208795 [Nicotiana attenuata]|uniref:uncharacterized protein LOC109208795 n=1 Tax=Nicotiana attenuata TaxID=49451 RepID=UPI0009058EAE|nr:PREDICTED: uncharacterized protein LOC109208795 [Nicotiana attenuata]
MATLRDEILAFKQESNKPLHEILERYQTVVKKCSSNDMTNNMIQQTLYRGINTTNQCVVNQLAVGNFMTTPYAEACEILDEMAETSLAWQSRANVPQGDPNMIHLHKELQDHGKAIAELTTTMTQLAKAQLHQTQVPKQVHVMEGVNANHLFILLTVQVLQAMRWVILTNENMFKQRMEKNADSNAQLASHTTSIRNLEVQMGQIYHALNTRPKGALPSHIVVNPKGGNNMGNVIGVITKGERGGDAPTSNKNQLMDYDQVIQEEEISRNDVQVRDDVRIDIEDSVEETQEEDQFKKFIQMIKGLSINVPLVETWEQIPGYPKFMKDLLTKKRSMNFEIIKVTHQMSTIVHAMAPKLEDPGAFSIPCTIGSANFAKALYDLRESINLMPNLVFKILGNGKPRPTYVWLQMADRTMKRSLGVIEEVLV